MKIRAGYEIAFECFQNVPMVLLLSVHPSRQQDLLTEQNLTFSPPVIARQGLDPFGNVWTRFLAPAGRLEIRSDFLVKDSGLPDEVAPDARQWDVNDLPGEVLPFLYGSRYCDTQRLSDQAWALFGSIPSGWRRVQAICDYSMSASSSATTTPAATGRRPRAIKSRSAFAATSPIWPLPYAVV